MKEIIKLGLFLMIASAIAAGALSGTYLFTMERIEAKKVFERQSALREVLPDATNFKELKIGKETYYSGFKKDKNIGDVFFVTENGYGGPIEMMVSVNSSGIVAGVKIISLKETPGLGSQAEKPKFLKQFIGKSSRDALKTKYDVQAITGATITSQAVANGVRQALEKWRKLR